MHTKQPAMQTTILTINPGSTTTKIVLFRDLQTLVSHEVQHSRSELDRYPDVWSQFPVRLQPILTVLDQLRHADRHLDAVVGRGGLLAPLPGGVYRINAQMLEDLQRRRYGEHPCNLGAPLAQEVSRRFGGQALIVDPVVTDELCPDARITGLPQIRRRSTFHALSQRGAAREAARRLALDYRNGKFIVAHLGGGVSIGAHLRGRVVEVTNALDGEGPMSPERSGALPLLPLLQLLEDGSVSISDLQRSVLREGGFFAHLGTNDFREIEQRVLGKDQVAASVFTAFVYAVAKHAASLLPTLRTMDDANPVDAFVLTGGLAHSELLVHELTTRLAPLAPVEVVLGLTEAQVMAESALGVLQGAVVLREYLGNDPTASPCPPCPDRNGRPATPSSPHALSNTQ